MAPVSTPGGSFFLFAGSPQIAVENFVLSPGAKDVVVTEVFTDEMFTGLMGKMQAAGWANLDQVDAIWKDDYKQRTVMKTFLQVRRA